VFIASLAGSFIHSVLVLSALFFEFMNVTYLEKAAYLTINTTKVAIPFFNTTWNMNFITDGLKFIAFIFLTSSIAEAIVSGFIATAIVMALRAVNNKAENNNLLDDINIEE
jgi:uncharacterized membrane protein